MVQETTITDYQVMFTIHTGVTVLIPKTDILDKTPTGNIAFQIQSAHDILVEIENYRLIIKDLQQDYLDEAKERGFIMFYELEDEEVVRCTPCQIQN